MNDYAKMMKLVQEVKELAKTLKTPIIGAQQLQFNPTPHQRQPRQPDVLVVDGSWLLSLPVVKLKKRKQRGRR